MSKCLYVIKRPMVTFPCRCDPTILCKTKLTASCTACWRLMVSSLHSDRGLNSGILLPFFFLWLEVCILLSAALSNDNYQHGLYHLYHFCIHLPSHCVVRNPPVMPSKYIRVPRKQPDKLGFDEVSKSDVKMESAKMALYRLLCWMPPPAVRNL